MFCKRQGIHRFWGAPPRINEFLGTEYIHVLGTGYIHVLGTWMYPVHPCTRYMDVPGSPPAAKTPGSPPAGTPEFPRNPLVFAGASDLKKTGGKRENS